MYKIQRSLIGLAEQYRRIDNQPKALNHIYQSLSYPIKYYLPSRQKWRNLYFSSDLLFAFGLYEAASIYAEEENDVIDLEIKDNWIKHSSLVHLSGIYSSLQRYEDALEKAELSDRLTEKFTDEKMRQRLKGESLLTVANVQRELGKCNQAIRKYDQVIEIFSRIESTIHIFNARKGRLLCYIQLENRSLVQPEIDELLDLFNANRQKITEETDRNIYFDKQQNIYDIAIEYAHTQLNDTAQAFNYAENSRARSLLDLMARGHEVLKPFNLNEIQKQSPENLQIVYYVVLQKRLLIWVISRGEYKLVEKNISSERLEKQVSAYAEKMINSPQADVSDLATELYKTLVEPLEAHLDKSKTICFIADKFLFKLSFASLISPKSQKYLIEENALMLAPSATVLIKQTQIAHQKENKYQEMILSIGNPEFSKQVYPGLDYLPEATTEAKEITKNYLNSKVLVEGQALKKTILEHLFEADIIHFAGHYEPNMKYPALSKFILAENKSESQNSDLTVDEINKNDKFTARLIVLAACDTGVEKYFNGEGMVGASRAFLSADIPIVVASQWKVDSVATAELMKRFHKYRKKDGLSTIEALRQAQIDLLKDNGLRFQSPYNWAGFITIGGFARY